MQLKGDYLKAGDIILMEYLGIYKMDFKRKFDVLLTYLFMSVFKKMDKLQVTLHSTRLLSLYVL